MTAEVDPERAFASLRSSIPSAPGAARPESDCWARLSQDALTVEAADIVRSAVKANYIISDEQPIHTVYADFNDRDGDSLGLSCNGTKADLDRLGLVLRDGLRLRVSDGDLAGEGRVRWVPERRQWVIDLDPRTYEELR